MYSFRLFYLSKYNAKTITKLAEKVGQKSVDGACGWWLCQPKVPASMMKKEERND